MPPSSASQASAEPALSVTWSEIGRLAEAITFARTQLFAPAQGIREAHRLGPRGIWILGLISSGRIRFQSDIAKLWNLARSMVTEEMNRLIEAGLVATRPDDADRRQIRLELTAKGHQVNDQLGSAFAEVINTRLAGYSHEDLALCIRLLDDLAGSTGRLGACKPQSSRQA